MIAGRGTKDQGPAHALKAENRAVFEGILERLTEATIEYLSKQIEAGAEVVKLFDSWAGSLKGEDFVNYALKPAAKITQALKQRHPGIPVIAFPREAGDGISALPKQRAQTASPSTTASAPNGSPKTSNPTAVSKATSPLLTWSQGAMT